MVTPEYGFDCANAGSGKADALIAAAPAFSNVLRLNGRRAAVNSVLATASSLVCFEGI